MQHALQFMKRLSSFSVWIHGHCNEQVISNNKLLAMTVLLYYLIQNYFMQHMLLLHFSLGMLGQFFISEKRQSLFKHVFLTTVTTPLGHAEKEIITYLIWFVFNRSLFWFISCSSLILWKIQCRKEYFTVQHNNQTPGYNGILEIFEITGGVETSISML